MQLPWQQKDRELGREMEHHLTELSEAYRRQGLTEREARQRARADFGGVAAVQEECRDLRWWSWIGHILRDVQFGLRMMRKGPGITVAALLSLALGIGATTAIVSLTDAVLLQSLAIPEPQDFYEVFWEAQDFTDIVQGSSGSGHRDGTMVVADYFSHAAFEAMRQRTEGKALVAAHLGPGQVSASIGNTVVVTKLRPVSGSFFHTLQLGAILGRTLEDRDDAPASAPVIVLSHQFWMRHLGGDEGAIGKTVRINNTVYEVAGVLPAEFYGIAPDDDTDVYASIRQSPVWLAPDSWYREKSSDPKAWQLQLICRRLPDATMAEVSGAMEAAFVSSWAMKPSSPQTTPRIRLAEAKNGLGGLRRSMGNPLLILCGLVALVLTVACANIANLLLARSASREKEFALRSALGSGQGRLLRQLFTESLMLASAGGLLSIPVAWMLTRLMLQFLPEGFERMLMNGSPDPRLFAATAGATMFAALLFGVYPAWRGSRVPLAPALKEGTGSAGTLSRWMWTPAKALVLVQVALGVLLVSAAVLFTGHLWEVLHRDTGFAQGQILLFDLRPGEAGYEGERLPQFYLTLEERLRAVPGVEMVGLSRTRPMRGGGYWEGVNLPERKGKERGVQSAMHHSNAEFLRALGVPLVAGRELTPEEVRGNRKRVVIGERLARELKLEPVLGARVAVGDEEYEVVGVAGDARYARMTQSVPVTYLPFDYSLNSATILLRTSISPATMVPSVRAAIRELDGNLPLVDVYTLEEQISRTLRRERMFAWLCGSFGVLALVLCIVGLYGLFSYTTARRVPEIGIRLTVGASRGQVISQILSEGLRLASAGLVVGIPLALWCGWIAYGQKLLPEGEGPYWALAAALCALVASAFAAVIVPAVRAANVDPMEALRNG